MKKFILPFLAVFLTGCATTYPVVKMDHAKVSAYLCSRVDAEAKEFMVVPLQDAEEITAWCENGVIITVKIPVKKSVLKDA